MCYSYIAAQNNIINLELSQLEQLTNDLFERGYYVDAFQIVDSIYHSTKTQENKEVIANWALLLAKLNYEFGDYQLAQRRIDTILLEQNYLNPLQLIECLNVLSRTYVDKGVKEKDGTQKAKAFAKADSILQQSFQLVKDTSAYSLEYIKTLNAYAYNHKFEEAIPLYLKSIEKQEAAGIKEPILYVKTLKFLSEAYFYPPQQIEAFFHTMEKLKKFSKKYGLSNHNYVVRSIMLEGDYYYRTEDYNKSIQAYSTVEESFSHSYGKASKKYADALFYLGASHAQIKDFFNTEKIYVKAIEIEKTRKTDSLRHAQILYILADLYLSTGRYQKAISTSQKVISIYKNNGYYALGRYSAYFGLSHLNIGKGYFVLNDYQNAEKHFSLADSIFTKNKLWNYLITTKRRLGTLNRVKENFREAQNFYQNGIDLAKQHAGNKRNLMNLYSSIASSYYYQKELNSALHYAIKAKKSCREIYGEHSIPYTGILSQLGKIFEHRGSYSMAKQYYNFSINKLTHQLRNYYPALSEEERILFLESNENLIAAYYGFAVKNAHQIPSLALNAQNLALSVKGLGLETSRNIIAAQGNSQVEPIYNEWLAARKKLRDSFNSSKKQLKEKNIDPILLQEQISLLEKQMGFKNQMIGNKQPLFKDLKNKLTKGEAVIDFVHFRYGEEGWHSADSIQYCALITKSDAAFPLMIPLCKESELKSFFYGNIKSNTLNYITTPEINKELYQLIWEPISTHLQGIEQVYLSPSGLLHNLAFGTLSEAEKPLIQKYNFVYYASLRDFISSKNSQKLQKDIVLLGGADFNSDIGGHSNILEETDETIEDHPPVMLRGPADSTRNAVSFDYLPGTEKEVKNIAKKFEKENWNVHLFTGANAIEEVVKTYTREKAPQILHIATHGFFFKPSPLIDANSKLPKENIQLAKNPLFRSGLVFTGANKAWKEGIFYDGIEDGILTAFEIYNLDLSKTELVVLSACDTGKGDVFTGEGVFGMQRAFLLAGANKLILSLWKVPDQATALLMDYFYQFIIDGLSIKAAFTEAQRKIIKEHPDWPPYYWGAFVLLD